MHPVSLLFHDVFVRDPRESGFASAAADRYKLPVREFDAQLRSLGQARAVKLTFDDGGVSFYTIAALALELRGLRAYCFVTTGRIGSRGFLTSAQLRELDARDHILGVHSATHPARFSALSDASMRREWTVSRRALEDVLGHAVTVASVPGGYFSSRVAAAAAECGLRVLFTSEPVRATRVMHGCEVVGRFTIRRGSEPDLSSRLAQPAPWARWREWAAWHAKGLVKPLLGSSYPRVADWIYGGV